MLYLMAMLSLASGALFIGSTEDDNIVGTDLGDRIAGGESNGLIKGQRGDDTLIGNDGDDGNDTLSAGIGHDLLRGGQGNDNAYGGEGTDLVYGEDGNDVLGAAEVGRPIEGIPDATRDIVRGEASSDTLVLSDTDRGSGADGNDLFVLAHSLNNAKAVTAEDDTRYDTAISIEDFYIERDQLAVLNTDAGGPDIELRVFGYKTGGWETNNAFEIFVNGEITAYVRRAADYAAWNPGYPTGFVEFYNTAQWNALVAENADNIFFDDSPRSSFHLFDNSRINVSDTVVMSGTDYDSLVA